MGMNKLTKGHNLRWESSRMMLPEHRERLLAERRKQGEFKPPLLDEQQLEAINGAIRQAIVEMHEVTIIYAEKYGPTMFSGLIQKIDRHAGLLKISNAENSLSIPLRTILHVEMS